MFGFEIGIYAEQIIKLGKLINISYLNSNNIVGQNPIGIDITSDGLNVYVCEYGSGIIHQYSRNTSTGSLSIIDDINTGHNALYGLVASPNGKYVYVMAVDSNTILIYSRSASTGLLTYLGAVASASYAIKMLISSDGKNLYVYGSLSYTMLIFSIDTFTGMLTNIGTINFGVASLYGMAITSNGKFIYFNKYDGITNPLYVYIRDTSTGLLSGGNTALTTNSIAFTSVFGISPDGNSLYIKDNNLEINNYSIDPITGSLTLIDLQYLPYTKPPSGDYVSLPLNYSSTVIISFDGLFGYYFNYNGKTIYCFSINAQTGDLAVVSSVTVSNALVKIMNITPNGKFIYASDGLSVNIFSRNVTTGQLTFVSSGNILITTSDSFEISSDGAIFYIVNYFNTPTKVYTINNTTGALTYSGVINDLYYNPITSNTSDNKFAYSCNWNLSNITIYSRNTSTGLLSFIASIATPYACINITISPDGKFAYVGMYVDIFVGNLAPIYIYSRDINTGLLTLISTDSGAHSTILILPDGNHAISSNNVFSRDSNTGYLTRINVFPLYGNGDTIASITYTSNWERVYILYNDSAQIEDDVLTCYTFNNYNGVMIPISTYSSRCNNTILYPIPFNNDNIVCITNSDGVGSTYAMVNNIDNVFIGNISSTNVFIGNISSTIVVSPDNSSVYIDCSGAILEYDRNVSTKKLTPKSQISIASGGYMREMVMSSDSNYLYAIDYYGIGSTYLYSYSKS